MAERKEIVRQIIQQVVVAGEGTSERLQVTIEWVGGGTTAGIITRPISRIEHLSYYPLLCERLRTLAQAGYSTMRITESLAQEGFRSPKQGRPLSRQSVHELMQRLGVHQPRSRHCPPLSKHEWWFSDLGDFRERFSRRLHTCSPASHPVLGGGKESVHTAVDHNEGGSF